VTRFTLPHVRSAVGQPSAIATAIVMMSLVCGADASHAQAPDRNAGGGAGAIAARSSADVEAHPPQTAPSAAEIEPMPRWDVSGAMGWRTVLVQDELYDDWDHRFAYVGTFGYYWTPHLKTEVEIGGASESEFYTTRPAQVTGLQFTPYVQTDHHVTTVPIAGARVVYQFFENQWFHPFAGVGVTLDVSRDRTHTPRQTAFIPSRPNQPPETVVIAEESRSSDTFRDTRAAFLLGFKAYGSAHAFVRGDVLWTVGSGRGRYRSFRFGMGVDF
jgi:hypothetical protein